MDSIIKHPKNVDELVAMMQERKKNSKIENEKKFHSAEYQEFLKELRALNNKK